MTQIIDPGPDSNLKRPKLEENILSGKVKEACYGIGIEANQTGDESSEAFAG